MSGRFQLNAKHWCVACRAFVENGDAMVARHEASERHKRNVQAGVAQRRRQDLDHTRQQTDIAARVAQIEHAAYLASQGLSPASSAPAKVVYHAKGRKPRKRKASAVEQAVVEKVVSEAQVSKVVPVRRPPPGLSVGPSARVAESKHLQESSAYRANSVPDPVVDESKVDPNTGMGQWVASEPLAIGSYASPEPVSMAPWDADSEEEAPHTTTEVNGDRSDTVERDERENPQEEEPKPAPIRMQLKKTHRKHAKR